MTSFPRRTWHLLPPDSPPSAPVLHNKAKNKPFALLQSLEPPRGPDYFLMERFRGYRQGCGGGFNRFSGGNSASPQAFSDRRVGNAHVAQSASMAGDGGAVEDGGAGMVSFRKAATWDPPDNTYSHSQQNSTDRESQQRGRSQGSECVMTPARSSSTQKGFSLFGGAAFSTPGSSCDTQIDVTPTATSERGSINRRGGVGSNSEVPHGTRGISRFKPLARHKTPDDESRGAQRSSLGLALSPPAPVIGAPKTTSSPSSSPSPVLSSSESASTAAPFVNLGKAYTTPSPVVTSSQERATGRDGVEGSTLGGLSTPVASLTAGRKRPRLPTAAQSPSIASPFLESDQRFPLNGGARQERTWENVDNAAGAGTGASEKPQQRGQQHQKQRSTRLPTGGEAATPSWARGKKGGVHTPRSSSASRSSRPKKSAGVTPSPRGRGGTSCGLVIGAAPMPRKLTLEDFAGADEVCFNPGASSEGLAVFLERCEARGVVALSILWADLTTSFSAVTVKGCLPSQRCHRWNCACGRQPRACQATAPMIGAVVYIPAMADGLSQKAVPSAVAEENEDEEDEAEFLEAETYLLPLGACQGDDDEARRADGYQLPIVCQATYEERWQALATLLAMPVKKVTFNAQVALMPFVAWASSRKRESLLATTPGVDDSRMGSVSSLFDPRVAAWMTDTGSSDKALEFEALCVSRLGCAHTNGSSRGEDLSTIVSAVSKIEGCSRRCVTLAAKLSRELDTANMLSACEEVEMPAIPVLAGMEVSGVVFLPERVTRFSHALDRHLDDLRRTASAAAGGADFNLASPDQVAELLFKHLGLPSPPLKAGSTHASTSAEVLEGLLGKHPVVAPILEFRGVNKLKTTYVDKLAEKAVGAAPASSAVPASQGVGAARLHAAWNQTAVRTGRLSCSRPNLQQIPKGSDPLAGVAGVNIRDAFVASRDFTLVAADYSQIEMRVLADACQDPGLAGLFASSGSNGGGSGDVYRRLAAQVFAKQDATVSDSERTRAKVVCLGIIYGMGNLQVARKLGVTESQAQVLVRSFLKAFPRIEPFLAATRRYAREKGFVCTLTGRRRHLPEINNAHSMALKAQAERQAVNSVVQGTAADIIKSAMVLVADWLDNWRSSLEPGDDCPRMIMQIHDELVFECPAREEDLGKLKGLLKECMEVETPARLGINCPLTVNMLVGMSWGSMRPVVVPSDDSGVETDAGGNSDDLGDGTQPEFPAADEKQKP